jgi:cysteine desulfurase
MKFPLYLDCHSTTPLDPAALDAMMPYLTSDFGNASSKSHCFGWKAEAAVEKARSQVAKILGATSSREIVFTSGATESNNFVLSGIAEKYGHVGKHIITTTIEHKCVLACRNRRASALAQHSLPHRRRAGGWQNRDRRKRDEHRSSLALRP